MVPIRIFRGSGTLCMYIPLRDRLGGPAGVVWIGRSARVDDRCRTIGTILMSHRQLLAVATALTSVCCASIAALQPGSESKVEPPAEQSAPQPAPKPGPNEEPAKPVPGESRPAGAQPTDAKPAEADAGKPKEDPMYVLGFAMEDILGGEQKLEQYKGKVVIIVNVASNCGFTPQYEGLQRLYEKKQDEGLVILGFPSNDFGEQEPGTNAEIKEYCSSKYGVTFPMFSKISVIGEKQHPLYKKLSSQPAPVGGDPNWNFTKFIVDRSGKVVARFNSRAVPDDTSEKVSPESKAMAEKIDELLKAKA
jgi:glutathione peroxidase